MISLNRINYNVKKGARKFVTEMGKNGYAPVILLEATVVAGRTYQAHKRGGKVEARERLTEETLGSVFWLGGVAGFSKLGDFVGKKIMGLKDVNFDTGHDHARKPLQNYLAKIKKTAQNNINFEKLEKNLATFKFVKIITSVLLANTVMGVVVPKINQAITKKQLKAKNKAAEENNTNKTQGAKASIEDFINKTKQNNKDVSFNGIGAQGLLNATNYLEQDATIKLILTDVGTVSGRAASARNKNEKLEILVRDIGSIYFYLYASKHINSGLNMCQDNRATRLDPVMAKHLDKQIRSGFKDESYSLEAFREIVLGKKEEDIKVPENIASKFTKEDKAKGIVANKTISLEEFEKLAGKNSEEAKIARHMSKIQPKLSTGAILTESQVKDIYTKGLINDPRFLNAGYRKFTNKASAKSTKFVAEKDLIQLKERMTDYVKDIIEKAHKARENITLKSIDQAKTLNFRKNAFNLGAGFAISALFLSTLIPKAQYWITKKQTGQDKFPGVQ